MMLQSWLQQVLFVWMISSASTFRMVFGFIVVSVDNTGNAFHRNHGPYPSPAAAAATTSTTTIATMLHAAAAATTTTIDFQSDASQFGRGEMHLSAMINEGDVVVYQAGSWTVDGVVVGDDSQPPSFHYCQIETIQLVWTHNCEHGVLRGIPLEWDHNHNNSSSSLGDNEYGGPVWVPVEPLDSIEFGPEQLVARIPAEWNAEGTVGKPLVDLTDEASLWQPME